MIGCGSIAQALHLPGYLRTPGVDLVAGCDPVPQRRKEAQRIAGTNCRVYEDHEEMLSAERLDVVSVATPNRFHAQHAIAALEAGAHVLLEKPAALSIKEIEAIRRAVVKSGRQLIVGFSHRFQRGNRKIKRMLDAGVIGDPYMFRMRLAHRGPYPGWAKSDWFYDPQLAGAGAMLDMGIHAIDQALWLIGPVVAVQGKAGTLRKDIRVDDNALLLLEFEGGRTLGYIEVGWTSPAGFVGIEIMGDQGCIIQNHAAGLTLTTGEVTPDAKKKPNLRTRLLDPKPTTGGWGVEVTDVVRALRRGEDLGSNIDAGGAALAVALAGFESSRTGKRVEVGKVRLAL